MPKNYAEAARERARKTRESLRPRGYPFVRWTEHGKTVYGKVLEVRSQIFRADELEIIDVKVFTDQPQAETLEELAKEESQGNIVSVLVSPANLVRQFNANRPNPGDSIYIEYEDDIDTGGPQPMKLFLYDTQPEIPF